MRYDYECPECGHIERDVEQTLAQVEAGEAPFCVDCQPCRRPRFGWCDCTRCEEVPVQMIRLIGPTSFALKGGGWAADGYASGKADK